jgi:protein MpaA
MDPATQLHKVPRSEFGRLNHGSTSYGNSNLGISLEIYGPADGPTDILILGALHGDELDGLVILSEALRMIPAEAVRHPVILSANPDGVLRGTRGNLRGVDLNRNWPASNWSPNPVRYKNQAGEAQDIELSPGDSAGSEPETRALIDLILRLQPKVTISLHSALGCIDDPDDSPLAHWIGSATGLEVLPDVGYPTPGSMGSWMAEQGFPIITWELPAASLREIRATHLPVLRKLITGEFQLQE